MMAGQWVIVDTFQAVSESGTEYTVHELRKKVDSPDVQSKGWRYGDQVVYQTSESQLLLTKLDNDTFEFVEGGEKLFGK